MIKRFLLGIKDIKKFNSIGFVNPIQSYNQSDKIDNLYSFNKLMVINGMCLNVSLSWAYYLNLHKWDNKLAFTELEKQHLRIINTQSAGQILYELSFNKYNSQKKAIKNTLLWQYMTSFDVGEEYFFDSQNINSTKLENFLNSYPFVLTCFYLKDGGGHATLTSIYEKNKEKRLSFFDPNAGEFNLIYETNSVNKLWEHINSYYNIEGFHLIGIKTTT